jgi:hypothetical protein
LIYRETVGSFEEELLSTPSWTGPQGGPPHHIIALQSRLQKTAPPKLIGRPSAITDHEWNEMKYWIRYPTEAKSLSINLFNNVSKRSVPHIIHVFIITEIVSMVVKSGILRPKPPIHYLVEPCPSSSHNACFLPLTRSPQSPKQPFIASLRVRAA